MMTILTNAYTTNLISFLTIPSLKPVPNTIAELAKEPHRKLTIEKEYVLAQNILVPASIQSLQLQFRDAEMDWVETDLFDARTPNPDR